MFEKEAEEALQKRLGTYGYTSYQNCHKNYTDGFEDGYAKANKANKWHDLRKNPDDLPEDGVQVLSEKGDIVIHKGFCWFEYSPNEDNIRLRNWEKPIAWREKPKFEEIDK